MQTQNIPVIIYHYTTGAGLLGILQEKAIWASKIHYMNDASELLTPLKIASDTIQDLINKIENPGSTETKFKEQTYSIIREEINSWERINCCVASFCTNGDLLSQWRGYGSPSSAYSIGFDTSLFLKSLGNQPFKLYPCNYFNDVDYDKEIRNFVLEIVEESIAKKHLPEDFIGGFVTKAASMKYVYFEEENEWRFISSYPLLYDYLKFRVGKSSIIPYYPIRFDLSSIKEIIIGPSKQYELDEDAVQGLAHKYELIDDKGIVNISIKSSKIPFRVL